MINVQVLKDARDLIARPGGWMQRYEAADVCGALVNARHPTAVRFCAFGALKNVLGSSGSSASFEREAVLRGAGTDPFQSLALWNDSPERTQAEVVAAFDKAIATAEAEAVQ